MSLNSFYSKIVSKFPSKHIKFAFAYGSGVFKQTDNNAPIDLTSTTPTTISTATSKQKQKISTSLNMIDFVFVVDDAIKFHDLNLKQNSSHYSFLKWLGPYYLTRIQNDFGAACYYNTLVPIRLDEHHDSDSNSNSDDNFQLIKYGVITESSLIRDLFDWDYLYISGRLQKPVKVIRFSRENEKKELSDVRGGVDDGVEADDDSSLIIRPNYLKRIDTKTFELALQTNLKNALHTALLLMPNKFTLDDLFVCITSLSYMGDFRMIIGENKNKCMNIVKPQMERFTELYKPYLIKENYEKFLECNFKTGQLEQNLNQHTIYHHLNLLPKNLIQTMINLKFRTSHFYDLEEYIFKLTNAVDYRELVAQSVGTIVKKSSWSQSAKGVFTAGLVKTVNYSFRKLKKMF